MLENKNGGKVRIDIVDMTELTIWVSEYINNDSCNVILVASKQLIDLVNDDEQLREIVESADMILPGANVKLDEIKDIESNEMFLEIETIEVDDDVVVEKTYVDSEVVDKLTKNVRKEEISLLVLANEGHGLNDEIKDKIEIDYPKIKFCENCYVDDNTGEDNIINKINAVAPDILFCTLKTPFQEKWILKNKSKINAKLCVLIGGELEDVLIKKNQGNKWLSKFGLDKIYAKLFLES